MKKDYSIVYYNSDTRCFIYKHSDILKSFGAVPKSIIEDVAKKFDLYLYGETCMYTGKHLLKVGKVVNDNGGVVNLLTTISKAKFNRFICEYVNTK